MLFKIWSIGICVGLFGWGKFNNFFVMRGGVLSVVGVDIGGILEEDFFFELVIGYSLSEKKFFFREIVLVVRDNNSILIFKFIWECLNLYMI